MSGQVHNRNKNGTLREKTTKDPTSMTVSQEKDDIRYRRQIHRREFISITVLIISKKFRPASNYEFYGFYSKNN